MTRPPYNRQSPRKAGYDYSQTGAYFVTICTYKGDLIFGDVTDGNMHLTAVGRIARHCWTTVSNHFDTVTIDCFVVMPNHVHAVVILHNLEDNNDSDKDDNSGKSVGKRHASSLQHERKRGIYRDGRYIPPGVESGSLGAIVGSYKSAVTKIANRTLDDSPPFLWQNGYHDHIIRDEEVFQTVRNYVLTNPMRWDDDKFNW